MFPSSRVVTKRYPATYPVNRTAKSTPFRHLNSGGWIAQAKYLDHFLTVWANSPYTFYKFSSKTKRLEYITPQPNRSAHTIDHIWDQRRRSVGVPNIYNSSDQFHATHIFLDMHKSGLITLDYQAEIFMSMMLGKTFAGLITAAPMLPLRVKATQIKPSVLHYNGPSKFKKEYCGALSPTTINRLYNENGNIDTQSLVKYFSFFDFDLNLVQVPVSCILNSKPGPVACTCPNITVIEEIKVLHI